MLPNNASDPKQVQVVQEIYSVEEATAHALQRVLPHSRGMQVLPYSQGIFHHYILHKQTDYSLVRYCYVRLSFLLGIILVKKSPMLFTAGLF